MATYAALQKQIAELERQAQKVRQDEIAQVVSKMKEAIAVYGITAKDLGLAGLKAVATRKTATVRPGVGVPRYRDPKSGKTWTGHGKPPMWIAGKKNRDEFLIDKAAASAVPAQPLKLAQAAKPAKAVKVAKAPTATKTAKPVATKAQAPAAVKRASKKTEAPAAAPAPEPVAA